MMRALFMMLAMTCSMATVAHAAVVTSKPVTGAYGDGVNWVGNAVPAMGDTAEIATGSVITVNAATTVAQLLVRTGATLVVEGVQLDVTGAVGMPQVGVDAGGILEIRPGTGVPGVVRCAGTSDVMVDGTLFLAGGNTAADVAMLELTGTAKVIFGTAAGAVTTGATDKVGRRVLRAANVQLGKTVNVNGGDIHVERPLGAVTNALLQGAPTDWWPTDDNGKRIRAEGNVTVAPPGVRFRMAFRGQNNCWNGQFFNVPVTVDLEPSPGGTRLLVAHNTNVEGTLRFFPASVAGEDALLVPAANCVADVMPRLLRVRNGGRVEAMPGGLGVVDLGQYRQVEMASGSGTIRVHGGTSLSLANGGYVSMSSAGALIQVDVDARLELGPNIPLTWSAGSITTAAGARVDVLQSAVTARTDVANPVAFTFRGGSSFGVTTGGPNTPGPHVLRVEAENRAGQPLGSSISTPIGFTIPAGTSLVLAGSAGAGATWLRNGAGDVAGTVFISDAQGAAPVSPSGIIGAFTLLDTGLISTSGTTRLTAAGGDTVLQGTFSASSTDVVQVVGNVNIRPTFKANGATLRLQNGSTPAVLTLEHDPMDFMRLEVLSQQLTLRTTVAGGDVVVDPSTTLVVQRAPGAVNRILNESPLVVDGTLEFADGTEHVELGSGIAGCPPVSVNAGGTLRVTNTVSRMVTARCGVTLNGGTLFSTSQGAFKVVGPPMQPVNVALLAGSADPFSAGPDATLLFDGWTTPTTVDLAGAGVRLRGSVPTGVTVNVGQPSSGQTQLVVGAFSSPEVVLGGTLVMDSGNLGQQLLVTLVDDVRVDGLLRAQGNGVVQVGKGSQTITVAPAGRMDVDSDVVLGNAMAGAGFGVDGDLAVTRELFVNGVPSRLGATGRVTVDAPGSFRVSAAFTHEGGEVVTSTMDRAYVTIDAGSLSLPSSSSIAGFEFINASGPNGQNTILGSTVPPLLGLRVRSTTNIAEARFDAAMVNVQGPVTFALNGRDARLFCPSMGTVTVGGALTVEPSAAGVALLGCSVTTLGAASTVTLGAPLDAGNTVENLGTLPLQGGEVRAQGVFRNHGMLLGPGTVMAPTLENRGQVVLGTTGTLTLVGAYDQSAVSTASLETTWAPVGMTGMVECGKLHATAGFLATGFIVLGGDTVPPGTPNLPVVTTDGMAFTLFDRVQVPVPTPRTTGDWALWPTFRAGQAEAAGYEFRWRPSTVDAHYVVLQTQAYDTNTGLWWHRAWTGPGSNAGAALECARLGAADGVTWRLPSFKELVTLVDHGRDTAPAQQASVFEDVPPPRATWSSTPNPRNVQEALVLDMADGQGAALPVMTGSARARCVRTE